MSNPGCKGVWEAKKINTPENVDDDEIYTFDELWAQGPVDDPGLDNDYKNVQFMRELGGAGTKRKRNEDMIIPTLSISEYSIAEHIDRIGFVARFKISPRAIGVIYQRITYRLESGGDEMSGEYTEAWTVNSIVPDKLHTY